MKNTFLFFPENLEDAKISIIGAPYDLNSSRRYGSRFAPDSIRKESLDMESNFRGMELSELPVEDLGNVSADNWRAFTEDLSEKVGAVVGKGSVPMTMGGDHSISPEIVRAIGRKDISVVAVDAHLDFDRELNGNRRSHSTPRRREAEFLGVENITVIGIRSWPSESMEEAKKVGINMVTAFEMKESFSTAVDRLPKDSDVYLTIDMDALDPSYAPGTGTPEPFGMEPWQVIKIIDELAPRIVGMDIVEVCPPCDVNGITSSLAAHFIADFIFSYFSSK